MRFLVLLVTVFSLNSFAADTKLEEPKFLPIINFLKTNVLEKTVSSDEPVISTIKQDDASRKIAYSRVLKFSAPLEIKTGDVTSVFVFSTEADITRETTKLNGAGKPVGKVSKRKQHVVQRYELTSTEIKVGQINTELVHGFAQIVEDSSGKAVGETYAITASLDEKGLSIKGKLNFAEEIEILKANPKAEAETTKTSVDSTILLSTVPETGLVMDQSFQFSELEAVSPDVFTPIPGTKAIHVVNTQDNDE